MIRVKDMEDYFMGGRRFGKIFMLFFSFGAGTSSEQAVSVVAKTWKVGVAGIWYQFLWLFATPFYLILAPVFRRMRALTTADFFQKRFGTGVATLYCIVGIWISITMIGATVYGSGKMVSGLTGNQLPYDYAVYAMTFLFVTYGMAGGLGAAVVTDLVQGILTIGFSFLLLPFILNEVGGFAGLHSGMPGPPLREGMFNMVASVDVAAKLGAEPITLFYILMLSVNALTSIVVQPHIMGVCAAGKTEFEGRFGFCFGNFMKRFCTIAWTFIGLACVVLYLSTYQGSFERIAKVVSETGPDPAQEAQAVAAFGDHEDVYNRLEFTLKQTRAIRKSGADKEAVYQAALNDADSDFADRVFGLAAHDLLPRVGPGLIGLLLASLLAAVMSSCDAQMMVGLGLFTENIYRRFLVKKKSQKHYVMVGRISGLLIVVAALLMTKFFENAVHAIEFFWKSAAVMGVAFWLGLIWRGYTSAGAWATTLTGYFLQWITGNPPAWFVSTFPFLFKNPKALEPVVSLPKQMLLYLSVAAVVGILVSLVTKRVDKKRLDEFYLLLRTPIRPGEKTPVPCTLPKDPLPPETGSLISHPDFELPKPSAVGLGGFIAAWGLVVAIIYFTKFLAGLGG